MALQGNGQNGNLALAALPPQPRPVALGQGQGALEGAAQGRGLVAPSAARREPARLLLEAAGLQQPGGARALADPADGALLLAAAGGTSLRRLRSGGNAGGGPGDDPGFLALSVPRTREHAGVQHSAAPGNGQCGIVGPIVLRHLNQHGTTPPTATRAPPGAA